MAIGIRARAGTYSAGQVIQDTLGILLFGAGLVISVAWGVWLATVACIGFIAYLVISFGRD